VGTGVFFSLSGLQQSAREADLSSPYSAKVTNEWSCTSASPVWFHGMHRDNFLLPFRLVIMCQFVVVCIPRVVKSPEVHIFQELLADTKQNGREVSCI